MTPTAPTIATHALRITASRFMLISALPNDHRARRGVFSYVRNGVPPLSPIRKLFVFLVRGGLTYRAARPLLPFHAYRSRQPTTRRTDEDTVPDHGPCLRCASRRPRWGTGGRDASAGLVRRGDQERQDTRAAPGHCRRPREGSGESAGDGGLPPPHG